MILKRKKDIIMKKRLLLILLAAVLLSVALVMTSCGNDSETTAETTPAASVQGTTTDAPVTVNPLLVTAFDKPEEYVTLPELSEIKVSSANVKKEFDAYIAQVLSQLAKTDYQPVAEGTPAKLGDSVNIHYTGRAKDENKTLSEATIKGMTNADDEKGFDLVLGSGNFIPGFEDQLVNAKKGETVTVDVVFPEDYHSEELCGVAILFEVKVNEISRATVTDKNVVTLAVSYALNGTEANGDIATFLKEHDSKLDMRDMTTLFDEYFDASLLAAAVRNATVYDTFTVDLTLSKEQAADFGYETELSLTATLKVKSVTVYPEALTDEDVKSYTGGEYTTVKDFNDYINQYYTVNETYSVIVETVKYAEIPADVYQALYQGYYDSSIYEQLGDISKYTEEELAEYLTDAVKKTADEFASKNATAEWKDRMLMGYLQKKVGFVLTEELYQKELKEIYDYYVANQYYMLLYYGISSMEIFEEFFGKETLEFQFINNAVLDLVAERVTLVD